MTSPPQRSPAAYFLAVGAFVLIGVVVAIAFLMTLNALGRGGRSMDGLALAAMLVVLPAFAGLFAVVAWLPFSLYRERRGRALSALGSLARGSAAGLVVALIWAGPSGFRITGGAPLFNYVVPLVAGVGSGVGTLMVNRLRR